MSTWIGPTQPVGIQVLTVLRSGCKKLIGKTERVIQTVQRRLEAWRIERQYPALPQHTTTPQRGFSGQTLSIETIVRHHCKNGGAIVQMHDNATTKLDAAEYAFSSMLEELRGAMSALPTTWTPERTWSDNAPAVAPTLAEAKAA